MVMPHFYSSFIVTTDSMTQKANDFIIWLFIKSFLISGIQWRMIPKVPQCSQEITKVQYNKIENLKQRKEF